MKELHIATDFYDEIHHTERFYDKRNFRDLMAWCRSLGATTLEWILDDIWNLYEDYPGGMDLLGTAVDAAHAEGLKFHVVYKPFEGVLANRILPPTLPRPEGCILWEDLRGLVPVVRPFVAAHPEMCFSRQPGDEDPGGTLRAIRLVKNDAAPVELAPEQISIWTSRVNGRFEPYSGPVSIEQTLEWRPLEPLGRTCRIITIGGLDIPASERYVEVRFAEGAFGAGAFRNEVEALVELVNEDGAVIPSTTAIADPPREHYVHDIAQPHIARLVRYTCLPEVKAFLADKDRIAEHAAEMRAYVRRAADSQIALEQRGHVSVARGKAPYLAGILNPIYPEVRAEWLRVAQFCIDRGADGIDYRCSSHLSQRGMWAYGLNPPVLDALDGDTNSAAVARVVGDAYTEFLREARDLLHAHGRQIGVHLLSNFLRPRDEGTAAPLQENMEYQWETWVADIADFAVFRGAFGYRQDSVRQILDRFGLACRRAGIPLVYQSNRRIYVNRPDDLHLDPDRLKWLEREMARALAHPDVAAYQLYETANFTTLDPGRNVFRGSPDIEAVTRPVFGPRL